MFKGDGPVSTSPSQFRYSEPGIQENLRSKAIAIQWGGVVSRRSVTQEDRLERPGQQASTLTQQQTEQAELEVLAPELQVIILPFDLAKQQC